MKIAIGSDHGGYNLKEYIKKHLAEKGIETVDFGTTSTDSCDYPEYAFKVAQAANKVKGIRAALCTESFSARMSREHNNANILCMGERVVGLGLAVEIVNTWLMAEFTGGRHAERVGKILEFEDKCGIIR